MKNLIIADYIGNSTQDDKPSGHLVKLLREIEILLRYDFDISFIVADNYISSIPELQIHSIVTHLNQKGNKIERVLQRYKNISQILKIEEPVWFINIDFWFYLYIATHRVTNKNIYTLNYMTYKPEANEKGLGKKIKWLIYKWASHRIKTEFVTCKKKYGQNQVYVPDYYFDPLFYGKYISKKKKNQVVFCGGITSAKEVERVIEVFAKNRQSLIISGKFENQRLYEKVTKTCYDNIKINNKRLSDEEYYNLIGESKYIILPYKESCYSGRSSGVILEALFLDAVIIGPRFLLNEIGIAGITYNDINDLLEFDVKDHEKEIDLVLKTNKSIKDRYSKEYVRMIYCGGFGE